MTRQIKADLSRLKDILDTYGANQERWPEDERTTLQQLLTRSEQAQDWQQQAAQLDQQIADEAARIAMPASLMGTLVEQANEFQESQPFWKTLFPGGFLQPVAGLMTAAALGVLVGWVSPNMINPADNLGLDEISLSDSVLEWEVENENG